AAAGAVEHAQVVRLVRKAFAAAGALGNADRGPAAIRRVASPVEPRNGTRLIVRPNDYATFVLGVPAYARNDPRRFALGVLNAAVGGGTSSRLFLEIRERRGLAYSVYSFSSQHVDTGYFAVAGGCMPKKVVDVLGLCRDEFARVAAVGISREELKRGQGQLRGGLVMGLEDAGSRMTRLGKSELVPGGLISVEESLASINTVTLDDVAAVAQQLLSVEPTLAVIGPPAALRKAAV
nr:insulinase family protein [Nocardioidaceae bacterium]